MQSQFKQTYTRAGLGLGLGALALAGCGGGGSSGSGTIEALTVADSMSVVTVESETAPGGTVAPPSQADTSTFAANAAYNTDVAFSRVYDPAMQPLQTVNMILCLLKQTAYSGLLNEGVYKAQIDELSCNAGGNAESSETGQSGGAAQAFNVWVVDSSRASNGVAQEVEFWIPGDDEDGEIRVRLTISEGTSTDNPFGVFDLNFIGYELDGVTMREFGNLHTLDAADGFVGFSFYQESGDVDVAVDPGDHAERIQANVTMSADQTSGIAHIFNQYRENHGGGDSGILENEFELAFDETHVLRATNGDTPVCLSRTEFTRNTFRYGLYDATTGDAVELESGFGFQTEGGDYGWAGYYGIWTPAGVTVADGDTITRNSYGDATATTYTVFKAPGKLTRNTRNTLTLTAIEGLEFSWWYTGGLGTEQFRVEYDTGAWFMTGTWNTETQSWDAIEPALLDTSEVGYLGLYSQALGGPVSFVHGDEFVTYWNTEVVQKGDEAFSIDGTINLYGYTQLLRSQIDQNEMDFGDVYLADIQNPETPWTLEFHESDMSLYLDLGEDLEEVVLQEGVTMSGIFAWGVRSGPMVTSTAGIENTFQIWNADVFYTWETGTNPWNQLTAILDDVGAPVQFDAPLRFSYTHTTEDDVNGSSAWDGRTVIFDYAGHGELHGIPGEGVDFDDDGNFDRWFPAFSIKDATLCGPTGTEYVLKALDSEVLLGSATGECGALSLDDVAGLVLPTDADWTDPELGAAPTVTDAPRVIEGTVVD